MEVDTRKTENVKNMTKPLTPTDINSFLGLAGHYRRFLDGLSSIAVPLAALTKMKVKLEWVKMCEKSFQELKDKLSSASVLTFPKCGDNYIIYCDASLFGLGCDIM